MPHSAAMATVVVLGFPVLARAVVRVRDVTQAAPCLPNYDWLDSKQALSPCQLMAAVSAPCFQGGYNVSPLTANSHYDPPIGQDVTRCTCSWAAYNLNGACTACQGQTGSINTWPSYKEHCDGYISNTTYWPSDILIAANRTIPAYAGTNPNQWPDQRFDIAQAKQIAEKNQPDLTSDSVPTTTPTDNANHKPPIGAIAGGVVGGVVLLAGLGVLLWICKRRRRSRAGVQLLSPSREAPHNRNESDDFQTKRARAFHSSSSFYSSFNPSPAPSPPPMSPAQTMYTYEGSMQTFSQFGAASAYTTPPQGTSPSHGGHVMSPAPAIQITAPGPADHIQPYTLRDCDTDPVSLAHRRKAGEFALDRDSNGTQRLEGVVEENPHPEGQVQPTTQPPAYSPYPSPSETASSHDVAAARREMHGHGHRPSGYPPEKGSQDTQSSYPWTSTNSGGISDSTITTNTPDRGQSRTESETQNPRPAAPVNRYHSMRSVGSEDGPDIA
ncbi:hypothetical protein V5O48_008107 [Marasmius crinis-equi]|uniref:Uncharacterized protein n=1 Tax=Marasmius crinis-equi TaxID=585013 RepID=A0ABR3FF87_9AGAR